MAEDKNSIIITREYISQYVINAKIAIIEHLQIELL